MGLIESWLIMLLTKLLEVLIGKATDAISQYADKIAQDQERGEVNEANQKAYAEAVDRADRIKRAGELLNGMKP
jgi:hypothetical protein